MHSLLRETPERGFPLPLETSRSDQLPTGRGASSCEGTVLPARRLPGKEVWWAGLGQAPSREEAWSPRPGLDLPEKLLALFLESLY